MRFLILIEILAQDLIEILILHEILNEKNKLFSVRVTPLVNTNKKLTLINSCLSKSACATRAAAGRWAALGYRNLYDHHFL